MQTIIDQAQTYITAIALAVVGVLATVILRAIALLQQKANSLFDARLSVSQRELLYKIASEGFAFAQTVYKDLGGRETAAGTSVFFRSIGIQRNKGIH
ncbi:hypothetical protein D3C76_242780 [compost metagenome]